MTYYDQKAWERFSRWLMSQEGHPAELVSGNKFARWTIDPRGAGTASLEVRSDLSVDFPTINQQRLGLRNRYTYVAAFPHGTLKRHAVVKYDADTGQSWVREYPPGQMPQEPWFHPASSGHQEDDGWLMTYVSDLQTQRSVLEIIDASRPTAKPVAVIEIPGWVPAGVHGSWIDDAVMSG
jgi:carotenoid cleavage dioxygenase